MRYEDTLPLLYQRCFVCRKRVGENAAIIYEDAIIDGVSLPKSVHLCSVDCDRLLQENLAAIVCHPQRHALDILDLWDDLYDAFGADCPLPFTLIEEDYPELFDYFGTLLTEATELHCRRFLVEHPDHREPYFDSLFDHRMLEPWEVYRDDFQGYHDEWPQLIVAAREILS
jgi:hypothetical protein